MVCFFFVGDGYIKAQWHQICTDDARATDTATCPSSMEILTDGNFPYTSGDEARAVAGSTPKAKAAAKKEELPQESAPFRQGQLALLRLKFQVRRCLPKSLTKKRRT